MSLPSIFRIGSGTSLRQDVDEEHCAEFIVEGVLEKGPLEAVQALFRWCPRGRNIEVILARPARHSGADCTLAIAPSPLSALWES